MNASTTAIDTSPVVGAADAQAAGAPPASALPVQSAARRPTLLHRLLREPLLHFIVLGAAVFALDAALVGRKDDPRRIVVGTAVDQEATTLFRGAQGRDPTPKELQILRERWVDNEVLYREGLALGVDRGDTTIRERVIFKALSMIESNLKPPAADDATLREFFLKRRADYDTPDRFDFLEAVVVGDKSEAAVQAFVTALNAGAQSDAQGGLRVFKARPRGNIVDSYGAPFLQALEVLPPQRWQALQGKDGVHVVALQARTPGAQVDFESVKNKVRQNWVDVAAQQARSEAVRELAKKYRIQFEQAAR